MDPDKWTQIITTFIIASPTFWTFLNQLKKDKITEQQTKAEEKLKEKQVQAAEDQANIDNAQKITAQAMAMVAPLTDRVTILENEHKQDRIEIDALRLELSNNREELQSHKISLQKQLKRIKTLESGIEKLIKQIKDAGYEPVFVIPEGD